jgi:ABC-2 type transport system ATP-binding protein
MSQTVVRIAGLGKRYGSFQAVDSLNLEIDAGEIVALLGPNGAGKTTTIKMLMGVLQPSTGTAEIGGLDCFARRAEVMRSVGYLPDEPTFYDHLRGRELLRFVGEMRGMSAAAIDERAAALATRLGLDEALEEFAVNYSKGMRKKLALAAALLGEPRVLILDEPSNGLDPFATRTLHEIVREESVSGTAIFYSTHLLDQAEKLCSRVAILNHGRLAALGTLDELRAELAVGGSLEDVFFAVASDEAEGTAQES